MSRFDRPGSSISLLLISGIADPHTPPCAIIVRMDIGLAAAYWEGRLKQGKPIYRVRVRRLLELAGSERRGYVIVQKIRKVLDAHGLVTIPDFELAWIDSLVRVRLTSDSTHESLEPNLDRVVGEQELSDESIVDPAVSDQEPVTVSNGSSCRAVKCSNRNSCS